MNDDIHNLYRELMQPYSNQVEEEIEYQAGQKIDDYLESASEYIPEEATEFIGFTALTTVYFPSIIARGAIGNVKQGLEDVRSRLEPEPEKAAISEHPEVVSD